MLSLLHAFATFDIPYIGNLLLPQKTGFLHVLVSLWDFAFLSNQVALPVLLYQLNPHPRFKHYFFEVFADPWHLILFSRCPQIISQ